MRTIRLGGHKRVISINFKLRFGSDSSYSVAIDRSVGCKSEMSSVVDEIRRDKAVINLRSWFK